MVDMVSLIFQRFCIDHRPGIVFLEASRVFQMNCFGGGNVHYLVPRGHSGREIARLRRPWSLRASCDLEANPKIASG